MSLLEFLLDKEISDTELLFEVDQLEAEYLMSDVSDSDLLRDVESIEQQQIWSDMESQCDISNSQCVHVVEHAEEEFFDQFGVLNSQLLSDVTVLESQ